MKFTEKNNFIVRHTSKEYFSKDRELFKTHCPNSRLHADLKRVNSFNQKKLDGLMLWELLDKVSPEDILENREEKQADVMIENIDQAKEILVKMEIDPEKVSEEFLFENIGKPAKDFQSIMEVLKPSLVGDNKILTLSAPPSDVDSTPIDSIDGVKEFLIGVFSDANEIPEEFVSKLVGKTKEEILMAIDYVTMYASITNKNDGLLTETGTETSQNASVTTESNGSEVKKSEDNPENGNSADGTPTGESISEFENKNTSGSADETGKDISGISEDGKKSEGSADNNASDESPLNQELEEKAKELEEKEEELTDKELELEEKEESLEEKAQELEDKETELSEKEAELEKTSAKKKEENKKNSPK